MSKEPIPLESYLDNALVPFGERARDYASRSKAENTLEAYRGDINDFTDWCKARGIESDPPCPGGVVAEYLAQVADKRKLATVRRRLAALNWWHTLKGHIPPGKTPEVIMTLDGIKRTKAQAGEHTEAKRAIVVEELRKIVFGVPETRRGIRDRALILMGFGGALRRSELVRLRVRDVRNEADGLRITIPYSKTDQFGEGQTVGVNYGRDSNLCPVLVYRYWRQVSEIKSGFVFRPIDRWGNISDDDVHLSEDAVALILKRAARRALGRDFPCNDVSGHSLRAGYATSSAIGGGDIMAIKKQMRHKSVETTMKYVRDAEIFKRNGFRETGL